MARTVNEGPRPRPPRGRVLIWLQRALLAITCLLVAVVTVAGVSLYQLRHTLLEQGVRQLELAITEALGVPVHVGRVRGPFWNGLDLEDLQVRASHAPGAPVIGRLSHAHASYSLFEVLRQGQEAVTLDADGLVLDLRRDARGRLNYQPRAAVGPQGPRQLPELPPIHVRVHDARVRWHDAAALGGPFTAELHQLHGRVDLVDRMLRFHATLREAGSRASLDGKLHLERLDGQVEARLEALDAPRWIDYLAHNKDVQYLRGTADVQLAVAWGPEGGEPFSLKGAVGLHQLALTTTGVQRPIENVEATATFDQHEAHVSSISGTLCGNRFEGKGVVGHFEAKAPTLAFTGGAPAVALATLVPLVPDLAMYRLSGTGIAKAVVTGTTHRPVVDVQAVIPAARALDQTVSDLQGQVRVVDQVVTISRFTGAVAGGRAEGDARFTLEPTPRIAVHARFDDLALGQVVGAYATPPHPLVGRLRGEASLGGTTRELVASGSVRLAAGRYAQLDVSEGHTDFRYVGKRLYVDGARFQLAGGEARIDGWLDEQIYAARVQASSIALSALRAAGVAAPVDGVADASGSVAGSWAAPLDFQAHGDLVAREGHVVGQTVEQARVRWDIRDALLTLTDGQVEGAGGRLGLDGTIALAAPFRLEGTFRLQDLAVERVTPLQQELVPYLGLLRGRLDATGSVRATGDDWQVRSYAVARQLEADRFGRIERIAGPLSLAQRRLTLGDLDVQWTRNARARLGGSVMLGDRPELGLHLVLADAPARELLASVHWPQLLQGTWIGRRMEEGDAPTVPRVVATLEGRAEASSSYSLKRVLDHWKRHRLEPVAAADEAHAATRPFWESFEGMLAMDVSLEGLASDPELRLRTSLHQGMLYGHPMKRGVLDVEYRHHQLTVPTFEVVDGTGASLVARGSLGPDSTLAIFGNRLDLSWLNPWLMAQGLELGGIADFTLIARGDPQDPRFEASAEVLEGGVGPAGDEANRFSYERAEVRASYASGRLNLVGGRIVKDGKEATIAGSLPIVPGTAGNQLDLALELDGESLGIITALTRGEIRWLGGPGHATVRLGGTLEAPELSGALTLAGASFEDRSVVGPFTDLRAHAVLTTDALTIQDMSARHGNGTLSASGRITLSRFTPDQLQLQLLVRHAEVALTSSLYRGLVDASVDVGGTVKLPSLGGLVTLSRGTLDLEGLKGSGGSGSGGGGMIPIAFDDLLVKLDSRNMVKVLGNRLPLAGVADARQLEVMVDGNLITSGLLESPQLRGTIFVRSGTFTPLYNPFDIVSGSLEFLGTREAAVTGTEGYEDLLPTPSLKRSSGLPPTRLTAVARGQIYDYNPLDFKNREDNKAGGMLDIKVTVSGSLESMERRFECINEPQIPQDRIEKVLGKESLVTGIFNGQSNDSLKGRDIVVNEVSGFLSTASRRFFNPFTSRLQDWLQLESFGFDFVPLDSQKDFGTLGLSPSLYTETRTFMGGLSLGGRYTFRSDRSNVYQTTLNYRFNEFFSLQAGLDNRTTTGQPAFDLGQFNSLLRDVNPAVTGTVQLHF